MRKNKKRLRGENMFWKKYEEFRPVGFCNKFAEDLRQLQRKTFYEE